MVKIRLMRMGAKKRPFYRVVVADARSPRDGRFIENIGKYHPLSHPSLIEIDEERALHWLRSGAQPSQPVRVLLEKTGIWARHTGQTPPPPLERPADAAEASPGGATVTEAPEAAPAGAEAPPGEVEPASGEATMTPASEAAPESEAAPAGGIGASEDGGAAGSEQG